MLQNSESVTSVDLVPFGLTSFSISSLITGSVHRLSLSLLGESAISNELTEPSDSDLFLNIAADGDTMNPVSLAGRTALYLLSIRENKILLMLRRITRM